MTNIEQKALALVNEIERERGEDELTPRIMRDLIIDEALCRAIEQHEAFRQEVSDAVFGYFQTESEATHEHLCSFIAPAPKPDPLVEAMAELAYIEPKIAADNLRAALEARGLEIREKSE